MCNCCLLPTLAGIHYRSPIQVEVVWFPELILILLWFILGVHHPSCESCKEWTKYFWKWAENWTRDYGILATLSKSIALFRESSTNSNPEGRIQIGSCKKSLRIFSVEKFSEQLVLCSDKWRDVGDGVEAGGRCVLTCQGTVVICHQMSH